MKGKILSFVLIFLFGLLPTNSRSDEMPILLDLTLLNLTVEKTELVDEIKGIGGTSVKPKENFKMMVVILKGETERSKANLLVDPKGFEAISLPTAQMKQTKKAEIYRSSAICYRDIWIINDPGATYMSGSFYIRGPGKLQLKVAFIIPKDINTGSFTIRIPTTVRGEAFLKSP